MHDRLVAQRAGRARFRRPLCFVLAGAFLFAAARRAYASAAAGAGRGAAVRAESEHAVSAIDADDGSRCSRPRWRRCCGRRCGFAIRNRSGRCLRRRLASNAASLTRYEGWFLIPFVALYLLAGREAQMARAAVRRRWPRSGRWPGSRTIAITTANALEFYNGPWSAMAIYRASAGARDARYPGDHDWRAGARSITSRPSRLVAGWPLIAVGAVGRCCGAVRNESGGRCSCWRLPPAFYVWSMHSSGTPIFVPTLWPHSWYNTRYALAVLPLAAFAAAAHRRAVAGAAAGRGAAVVLAAVAVGRLARISALDLLEGIAR